MKRSLLASLFLIAGIFLLPLTAAGQTKTVVSATVLDPNGVPYAGGSVATQLVPTGGTPTINKVPVNVQNNPAAIDANGHFTISLWCNTAGGACTPLDQVGTQWQFTITNPGAQPPVGFGGVSFTVSVTITGTTQDLSSTLSAASVLLYRDNGAAGSVTSIAATSPITATPNPITTTGTIACPTCETSAGIAANAVVKSGGSQSLVASSIVDNGGVTIASPTGGAQGAGTLNATGLFINGVAVSAGGNCPNAAAGEILFTDGTNCLGDSRLTWNNSQKALIVQGGSSTASQISAGTGFGDFIQIAPTSVSLQAGVGSATLSLLSDAGMTLTSNNAGISLSTPTGVTIGSPTGGAKGANTLNAVGLFVNGVAVSTGGGSISGLTTGFIPKAASSTSLVNSACDDGITTAATFTCSEAIATTPSGGVGGTLILPEGTSPGATASADVIYGDSTNHLAHEIANSVDVGVLLSQFGQTGNGTVTIGGGSAQTIFKMNALTSGSISLTVPNTVSSTATPLAISNAISLPAGSATQPSICSSAACGNQTGFFFNGNAIEVTAFGTGEHAFNFNVSPEFTSGSGGVIDWSSTTNPQGSPDTGLCRASAGTVEVSNGSTCNSSGNLTANKFTSTVATGTAPFTVASTTNVANLNASSLNGATFASPGNIGGTTPASVQLTTLVALHTVNSTTQPTIAGAGCGGSAASIPATNGNFTFNINVGTAPTSGGCTVTMPAATTGWNCSVNDFTTISTSVFVQKQTASSTTSVTFQNYSDVAVATAPTANDIYHVSCQAY